MLDKIISGGQTGVDRAALDAAIHCGIPHGGWCPKGRLAELDTIIPQKYNLTESDSSEVNVRTKLNIRDSDATLILVPTWPLPVKDGTILTLDEVKAKKKPFLMVNLSQPIALEEIIHWIQEKNIKILNIAGPRESSSPGIYTQSLQWLIKMCDLILTAPPYQSSALPLRPKL